jgi:ADP-ribose pyrophosphatase YjhB (NUDIX family)
MDDQIDVVEKLPKTSMLLVVVRVNSEGVEEYLLNKRLRQPYYGKVGFLTGKPHFGETFQEAVRRELFEEAGLHAERIELVGIYHKIRKDGNGVPVQDVIFYRHVVTEVSGTLIEKTPLQENFWATAAELADRNDRYDTFSLKTLKEYAEMELTYIEDCGEAKDF